MSPLRISIISFVFFIAAFFSLQYFNIGRNDVSLGIVSSIAALNAIGVYLGIKLFIHKRLQSINKMVLIGKSDHVSGILNTQLDDIEREVKEWALNREEEINELKIRENYQKEFIGNVAHELKTPIFSMQGYILTLLEGALEDPNINRKYLSKSAKSVDRLIRIVNDLDTISKFDVGQLHLDIQRFDIISVTNEVISELEHRASDAKISIRFEPRFNQLVVKADKERIHQVLVNLVINSIKYGAEGGVTEVNINEIGEHVLVDVKDNGLGISPRHIPRLFERFYRVEGSRSRDKGGSGLGLAIVKRIIEEHNQQIYVTSKKGEGSTFTFSLESVG